MARAILEDTVELAAIAAFVAMVGLWSIGLGLS